MQGHKRVHHVNFLQPCYRGLQHFSFPEYSENSGKCISITLSTHVETVVLLSQQKPDDTIEIDLDLDELDATSAELKATYQEIKDYVLKEFGLKVSNLYISQVKRKCGIEVEKTIICQRQKIPKCYSVRKRKKMLSRLP